MNILHITAQKPSSTGSGVYLTKLARELEKHDQVGRQGVLAGIYQEDLPVLREQLSPITLYPVLFDARDLPFHIFGMSDVMPYPSSQYRSMTEDQKEAFADAFLFAADKAVNDLNPDVILCHHLYYLTSVIRKNFPDIPVYAFCHNTDLTQFRGHDLAHKLILEEIPKLNGVFSLHEAQKNMISDLLHVPSEKIHVVGAGFDPDVFFAGKPSERTNTDQAVRLIFTGKLSYDKGVPHLLRALSSLHDSDASIALTATLVGGAGDAAEYEEIRSLAASCPYSVKMTGQLSGSEIADLYHQNDLFILPSLNEGLPLCVIEALACGLRVVMTDLPGIRAWLDMHVPDAPITYVPLTGDMKLFISNLKAAIADQCSVLRSAPSEPIPDLSSLTWTALSERVLQYIKESVL